ncbi:MAG: hypothetical protein ABI675_28145 [Chitinophagaceae bacterium]
MITKKNIKGDEEQECKTNYIVLYAGLRKVSSTKASVLMGQQAKQIKEIPGLRNPGF